jgi:hypothetical protein
VAHGTWQQTGNVRQSMTHMAAKHKSLPPHASIALPCSAVKSSPKIQVIEELVSVAGDAHEFHNDRHMAHFA